MDMTKWEMVHETAFGRTFRHVDTGEERYITKQVHGQYGNRVAPLTADGPPGESGLLYSADGTPA